MISIMSHWRDRLRQRILRYSVKRSGRSDQTELTQRKIYIFLTPTGWAYSALLLILFVCGINYANNLVLALCFFLAAHGVIGIYSTYIQLSGLRIALHQCNEAIANQLSQILLSAQANGRARHQLVFSWQWERDEMRSHHQAVLTNALEIVMPLVAHQRGHHSCPVIRIESRYPFGIFRTWSYVFLASKVWVYPEPKRHLARMLVHSGTSHDQSYTTLQQAGVDEFDQLKSYEAGEPLNRVAWRAFSQGKGMLSKRYIAASSQPHMLRYQDMPGPSHEDKIAQLAAGVAQCAAQDEAFACHALGYGIAQGSGLAHYHQVMQMLALLPKGLP